MKYSNEQIRGAILRASDLIGSRHDMWDWGNIQIPPCGTPGCALGHIGAFLGIAQNTCIVETERALGIYNGNGRNIFYQRINELCSKAWTEHPDRVAVALRAYADKYHPAAITPTIAEDRQLVRWDQCAWQPKAVA